MMDEEQVDPEPIVSQPQSSFSSSSFSQRPKKGGVFLRWAIILIVLGALIFAGVSLLRSRGESATKNEPTPTPTSAPTDTPIPTSASSPTPTKKPTPTPTKAATISTAPSKGITLKVLNGSGVAGRAGEAADFLRELGYTVSSTGNADTFDYDKAVITVTSDKSSALSSLKSDIASKYAVGTASATLSSSEGVGGVVIIGKQ